MRGLQKTATIGGYWFVRSAVVMSTRLFLNRYFLFAILTLSVGQLLLITPALAQDQVKSEPVKQEKTEAGQDKNQQEQVDDGKDDDDKQDKSNELPALRPATPTIDPASKPQEIVKPTEPSKAQPGPIESMQDVPPASQAPQQTPTTLPNTPASPTDTTTTPEQRRQAWNRLNPERLVIQAMMRILVKQGVFPEHVYELYRDGQNPVVDRAHFANVMVKALGHDTSIVSEFPVFRDVDKSHWAYAPIEVLRERKLMGADPQGFFHPEAPMIRQDAYLIIARTVAGKDPSLELANEILAPFSDADTVPPKIKPAIARLVNAKIIIPRPAPKNQLNIGRKMRYGELAAILSREIEIKDYRRLLLPVDKKTLPQIPGGLALSVVPNGAIYKNALAVGDTIYFSLTKPVQATINGKTVTIPRSSRLDGSLAAFHQQFYMVTFDGLQTPEGRRYRLHSELTLEFSTKSAEPFIVPGTPYPITTTVPE